MPDGSCWAFEFYKAKNRETIIQVFLLLNTYELPDELDSSHSIERHDYRIIIKEPYETWDTLETITIEAFLMSTKKCALACIEMFFCEYPKLSTISYHSSSRGLETAIKKDIFDYLDGEYFLKRENRG